MSSSQRQIAYALLTILGLVTTWYYNLVFMGEMGGFSLDDFFTAWNANAAASSILWDVSVAALSFCVLVFAEARRIGMRHAWIYPVLTFTVALGFAFPLFLFMRERHLAARP